MKTAEEILKKRIPVNGFITDTGDADYSRDECISAMIEYADQFKQKLNIHSVMQGLTDLQLLNVLHDVKRGRINASDAFHKLKGSPSVADGADG